MVVISNRLLGPQAELIVSEAIAEELLRELAAAAAPTARSRWELELVHWLALRAARIEPALDLADIAWTPDHFEAQRAFVLEAIARAAAAAVSCGAALEHCRRMVAGHPRDAVQRSRRWPWPAGADVAT